MYGINSSFRNLWNASPSPLEAKAWVSLPSDPLMQCVGVRSLFRIVLGIATMIISGIWMLPLMPAFMNFTTPLADWKCLSPSNRYNTGYFFGANTLLPYDC